MINMDVESSVHTTHHVIVIDAQIDRTTLAGMNVDTKHDPHNQNSSNTWINLQEAGAGRDPGHEEIITMCDVDPLVVMIETDKDHDRDHVHAHNDHAPDHDQDHSTATDAMIAIEIATMIIRDIKHACRNSGHNLHMMTTTRAVAWQGDTCPAKTMMVCVTIGLN